VVLVRLTEEILFLAPLLAQVAAEVVIQAHQRQEQEALVEVAAHKMWRQHKLGPQEIHLTHLHHKEIAAAMVLVAILILVSKQQEAVVVLQTQEQTLRLVLAVMEAMELHLLFQV
jgi:hypothetical protein